MSDSIVTAVLAVFTAIFDWLIEALTSVVGLFWIAETGLTFFGVLAIISIGIAIFFLLVGVIQNFLKFRS
ncbi:MAG: hypothetical protein IJY47_01685 [Clostridia bacterium]|nr:hypothetical protein [Clostridia bacterium]